MGLAIFLNEQGNRDLFSNVEKNIIGGTIIEKKIDFSVVACDCCALEFRQVSSFLLHFDERKT